MVICYSIPKKGNNLRVGFYKFIIGYLYIIKKHM